MHTVLHFNHTLEESWTFNIHILLYLNGRESNDLPFTYCVGNMVSFSTFIIIIIIIFFKKKWIIHEFIDIIIIIIKMIQLFCKIFL